MTGNPDNSANLPRDGQQTPFLSAWTYNKPRIRKSRLLNRLAKLLDVPLSYLLGESNSALQEKLPVPSGLKALEQDQALTETLNISEPEWLAMKTIQLPAETNKEGYVQLLYTIRAITK